MSSVAWLLLAAVSLWGSRSPQLAALDPMAFPNEFRQWAHPTTIVNESPNDPRYGYHDVYVNEKSLDKNSNQGVYPDGSKVLLLFYDLEKTPNDYGRGQLKNYLLMVKDEQLYMKTGGWGFASFAPDTTRQVLDVQKECWSCHSNQSRTDYVFTNFSQ